MRITEDCRACESDDVYWEEQPSLVKDHMYFVGETNYRCLECGHEWVGDYSST